MKSADNIPWYRYKPMWWLLLVLVVVRIPTFDRPLSKHDDFNNAVILINAVSWNEAGGGHHFYFTPVMNFQGAGNKVLGTGKHIDANGNHVYLSFGAGWYVLPYLIFGILHAAPSEAGLEMISIVTGLLSTLLLFRFLAKLTQHRQTAFYATLLFALLPAPLWYMGHSYVTTGIMLPLLVLLLQFWYQISTAQSAISWRQYCAFFVATIMLTYFDWIGVFLPVGMAAWYLFQKKWQRDTVIFAVVAVIAVFTAVFLILFQFASYLGWDKVQSYWLSRFSERSVSTGHSTLGHSLHIFIRFFLTGYGPLLFVLVMALITVSRKKVTDHWIWYAIGITAVYNLVFLNWSLEHEFAWMVMSLLVILWLAQYRSEWLISVAGKRWVILASVFSLAIYFFINRPGQFSRNGQRYDAQQNLGREIARSIPADAVIFTNLSNAKIEEWYARRTFNQALDAAAAQAITDSLQLQKAVWMEVQQGKIIRLQSMTSQPK